MARITIDVSIGELEQLGDTIELAESLLSQSIYSDRAQQVKEKKSVHDAFKIYTRIGNALREKVA